MFSLHNAFYVLRLSLSTCFEYSGPYRIVHSLTENRKREIREVLNTQSCNKSIVVGNHITEILTICLKP